MMYICFLLSSFGALYSGQTFCIYMGCTDIGYYAYGICSIWTVFMVMYLWLCVWMCVYGYVFMGLYGRISGCMDVCLWLCVWMCMGIGSRSFARSGSSNIGAYLSLGPVLAIFGTYSSTRPTSAILGTYSAARPTSSSSGLTPSRGPLHHH